MATNNATETLKQQSKWSRRLWLLFRLGVFGCGVVTVSWFFFSFIGIGIGICFIYFDKKPVWRRHGFFLAFAAGFSQLLGHVGHGLSPLYLAMIAGFGTMAGYGLYCLLEVFLKKISSVKEFGRKIKHIYNGWPKYIKVSIMIIAIILPIGFWSSVSLDFRVMFDNNPQVLWIHGPSTVNLNQSFDLTVEAWDTFERLSAIYTGTITFSIQSFNFTTCTPLALSNATLPSDYTFTGQPFGSDMAYAINDGKDNGLHTFSARINTPGIHYIVVNDSYTQQIYYSNPIWVLNFSQYQNQSHLYWGDLHTHSMLSDGSGSAEHAFLYAKEVARLDFHSLTDHAEILIFIPGGLNKLEATTQAAYVPHEFVTFPGIEWTHVRTGHYTLIFSGAQLLKSDINSYWGVTDPADLWQVLDTFTAATGCRALALPHHTTKKSYMQDWTYLNPKYVKIAEVSSVHGDSLYEQRDSLNYRGAIDPPAQYTNGSSITDALRMGYRLTLYAASDTHDGHPGHSISHTPAFVGHQRPFSTWHTRNEHPYPGGITGAWAPNLTREGVFSALYDQTICAVSDFGRPILNFTINGVGLGNGSTLMVSNSTDNRTIDIFLAQDGAPAAGPRDSGLSIDVSYALGNFWNASIEILKNGDLLTTIPVNTPVTRVNYTDTQPVTGTTYGVESCILKDGQYYINEFSDNPIDPALLTTNGTDFYVLRVVKANGRMAWAGPIWVGVN